MKTLRDAVGVDHSRSCSIFTGSHEQAKDGQPGRFRPAPCDCHLSRDGRG